MDMQSIKIEDLKTFSFSIWNKGWFILTSGDFAEKNFNAMTISWGSIGYIWEKPFVQVVVRPTRYTLKFMQSYPDFTVCAFSTQYRKALQLLGSKSGKQGDKIAESGLTPCKSSVVNSPSFVEANLVFECRKIYSDRIEPEGFIDPSIDENYPLGDYHRIFYGEVLSVRGDKSIYS